MAQKERVGWRSRVRARPRGALLREGIEAARQQGNGHAAGEMSELLMSLGAAGEE